MELVNGYMPVKWRKNDLYDSLPPRQIDTLDNVLYGILRHLMAYFVQNNILRDVQKATGHNENILTTLPICLHNVVILSYI
jgi:hypothetical protein